MRKTLISAAASLSFLALAPYAQAQTVADPAVTTMPADNDGDEFPWGLLGLLGLAGLLGMKRNDRVETRRP